jgi:outer membrane lipase/esterase
MMVWQGLVLVAKLPVVRVFPWAFEGFSSIPSPGWGGHCACQHSDRPFFGETMRSIKSIALCSIAAAILVACGGGGNGDQSPRVTYSSVVNFGDSLSDAGTYKVGAMANVTSGKAGGLFTVNGIAGAVGSDPVPTYTFAQLIGAAAVGTPTCAARSGGFTGTATLTVAGCTNYAEGGSRVTSPAGIGNNAGNLNNVGGALTQPVVTQISNYLGDIANAGRFKGTELVTVAAGANDLFVQAGAVGLGLPAGTAVTNMQTAASDLVGYINTMITNGATRIVVINVPDVSQTPQATKGGAGTIALFTSLVTAYNNALQTGLAGKPQVLFVDAYSENRRQFLNPTQYGLTNTTATACDLTFGVNPTTTGAGLTDGSSLACNTTNVIAGDTSHYLFADNVHPTPYGHKLLSQLVINALLTAGWL